MSWQMGEDFKARNLHAKGMREHISQESKKLQALHTSESCGSSLLACSHISLLFR